MRKVKDMGIMKKKMSGAQMIILGFAAVILLGSVLLMLPVSTRDARGASFSDALFTATSAVCVTGLVVQDTASYWSSAGQAIILVLIQIGGMGVVTLAVALSAASGRRISLRQRSAMQESICAPGVGGIVILTGFILRMTLIIELLGALLMAPSLCRTFGMKTGLWYSIFHSVSAFCNAGFDLMGMKEPFSSLTYFADDPVINLTIAALIVIGGIGFMTWDDVRRHGRSISRYTMQSKVILATAALLIVLPAAYFFVFEFSHMPLRQRFLASLFQSVTTRTAGFNTVNLTEMSESGLAIMLLLMLTGGAPGSTAGGMKTTTLAVMVSTACAVFRRRANTQFFGRRIPDNAVRTAATVMTMYIALCFGGGLMICGMEHIALLTALYEAASAVGTVGLSLGITPQLGAASRLVLIALMYIGRVGGLTLVFAALPAGGCSTSRLPQEKLIVG